MKVSTVKRFAPARYRSVMAYVTMSDSSATAIAMNTADTEKEHEGDCVGNDHSKKTSEVKYIPDVIYDNNDEQEEDTRHAVDKEEEGEKEVE
jgi:hypothetical protein